MYRVEVEYRLRKPKSVALRCAYSQGSIERLEPFFRVEMIDLPDIDRPLKVRYAWQSVVHLCMQTRNNFEVLGCVGVLAICRNFGFLSTTLLLRLSNLDPLLCCKMLSKFREGVLGESELIKQRTVLDGVKDNMVVGS